MIKTLTENKNVSPIADDDFSKQYISSEAGEKVLDFISQQVNMLKSTPIILSSSGNAIYENQIPGQTRTIIDLQNINNQKNLKSYFQLVNSSLPDAGIYIGCVETYAERKQRFNQVYSPFFTRIIWIFDFLINRVMSKCLLTKDMYSFFSGKKYAVISKAETLGRLCYAGFEIIGHETINNLLYFSVIKTREPRTDKCPPCGIFLKMKRVSREGKMIGIYKIRTMHPFSEYLQDYVVKMNGYNEVGKPNLDFRLTSWGKIIRKLHLDEIPQLLNVLKGELNIVGVRPISRFGFESLPEDLQKERIKYKPGCIPPNVSLGVTGFKGVIRAERIYLRQMKRHGFIVNCKYFLMALLNIVKKRNLSA